MNTSRPSAFIVLSTCAIGAALAMLIATPAQPVPITWPVIKADGTPDHRMLQGHGDGHPPAAYRFHQGIDIFGGGQGGEKVVAAAPANSSRKAPTPTDS